MGRSIAARPGVDVGSSFGFSKMIKFDVKELYDEQGAVRQTIICRQVLLHEMVRHTVDFQWLKL